ASLRSFKELKKKTRKKITKVKPKKALKTIQKIVAEQQSEFGQIYREAILPALTNEGIHLIEAEAFNERQQSFSKEYFQRNVAQLIQPHFLEEGEALPFLKEKGLYFVVHFADAASAPALVQIPSDELKRFIVLPSETNQHYITFLDDIIRANLSVIFSEHQVAGAYAIKMSRDAELYIDDEYTGDLIDKIRQSLYNRNVGLPTRFLYDTAMPSTLLDQLKEWFGLSKDDLIPGARYHNFNDFFGFPNPTDNSSLEDDPLPPLPHFELDQSPSVLAALRDRDFMLHFPYQSYDYVPRMIREAAADEEVESIKITLYRVASDSQVTQALLYALEKGKAVLVFIEAKARFDEASNLYWGGQLEQAGAKVIYSYPGIKVHTKLLLITRKERDSFYTYLGTGNFNEKTAKLYCDHALITTDARLGSDVEQVFDILERKIIIPKNKHLFIAPFNLRQKFNKLIDREIKNVRQGKEAYMILKMNSLEDKGMINKLYEASQAGVRIQLIVRGICCLVPGVDGLSENIEIISIVDRFLEHARVYIFANGGKEKMYTASADWMSRNLDRRIEVAMPIYDEVVYRELRQIISLQLGDNEKARWINSTLDNAYKEKQNSEEPSVRAQLATYHFLAKSVAVEE
ncbi:MAG: polyphosphate kinase 1, partial [Bacteroidota bacterium]